MTLANSPDGVLVYGTGTPRAVSIGDTPVSTSGIYEFLDVREYS